MKKQILLLGILFAMSGTSAMAATGALNDCNPGPVQAGGTISVFNDDTDQRFMDITIDQGPGMPSCPIRIGYNASTKLYSWVSLAKDPTTETDAGQVTGGMLRAGGKLDVAVAGQDPIALSLK
jgi:hypothetical protein